jgi:hypothetical protein
MLADRRTIENLIKYIVLFDWWYGGKGLNEKIHELCGQYHNINVHTDNNYDALFATEIINDSYLRTLLLRVLQAIEIKHSDSMAFFFGSDENSTVEVDKIHKSSRDSIRSFKKNHINYVQYTNLRRNPREYIENTVLRAEERNWIYYDGYPLAPDTLKPLEFAESRLIRGFTLRLRINLPERQWNTALRLIDYPKLYTDRFGMVETSYQWGERLGDKERIQRNKELLDKEIISLSFPTGKDDIHSYFLFLIWNDMRIFTKVEKHNGKYSYLAKWLLELFVANPRQFDRKKFLTHTYITGQSGSGKSELLKTIMCHLNGTNSYPFFINQAGQLAKKQKKDRYNGNPCILIDPHGDLAESFDGENIPEDDNNISSIGYINNMTFLKCWKIAPHESRFVVNPFDIDDKSPTNRELVAQEVTQMIIEMVADSGLSVLMETISFPIIYTLLKLPYADFAMFADCIRPSTGQEKLEALAGLVEPHHRAIWADLCGDTYDTTKRSVFNRLQSFLNKRIIVETITGRDDFGKAMERTEQGENLIISLPIPAIGEQASQVLGRFFLTRLQIWAKRRQAIAEKDRYPVFVVVDEVQNFLSAETARTLDQFGRKFGLFMVLANQHIKQIEDSQLKGSILANCKNKMVGMSDKATRQALAGEMGLKAEDFEGLKAGYFWGKFGSGEALKFYAKRIPRLTYQKDENGNEIKPPRPYYAETQNEGESPNGWELVGFTDRGSFRLEWGERAEKRKPKYDL